MKPTGATSLEEEGALPLPDLRRLLGNLPDPVVVIDGSGLVREANAAARKLLPPLRIHHPLSYGLRSPEILDAVSVAARRGTSMHVEYRQRTPVERVFDVQVAPLSGQDGDAASEPKVSLYFRDLTDALHLERMRVDFVANVSHELRTPLASLIGFIETLQGPARDDPVARDRFLEIMRSQAWRMSRLIEDLLSLSRIELREHVPPSAQVDLKATVGQMIETLAPLARERGVELTFSADRGTWLVLGDGDELLRLVENLVENAVKYGGSGGRVEVALARREAAVELVVQDYGPGIPHEHIPRLTERFYRVDVAASRDKGGTGLGLAIVKHIVNRHRGRLTIESQDGQGARFSVTFPPSQEPRALG